MVSLRKFSSLDLGLLSLLALAGCRQDMHDQPRFKPLAMSDFYPDMRSARPPVEGTVARGQLHDDTYFYTGKVGDNPGDYMPFAVTKDVLERGQQRFNIYCSPCHSRMGDGNGIVVQRGFRAPPSYHTDRLRKAPLGYFFEVMTYGYRGDAGVCAANSSARPLVHRGVHQGAAIEPGSNFCRRAFGTSDAVGASAVPRRSRLWRYAARDGGAG